MESNQQQNQSSEQQSATSQNVEPERALCKKCFSFYGTAVTNFLCSKCFKESGGVLQQPKQVQQNQQTQQIPSESEVKSQEEAKIEEKPQRPVQEDKTKCWSCKKKVGLTAVQCRCEYVFCSKHRYPEEHNCDFDFNNFYKKKLESENQKVVHKKVDKLI